MRCGKCKNVLPMDAFCVGETTCRSCKCARAKQYYDLKQLAQQIVVQMDEEMGEEDAEDIVEEDAEDMVEEEAEDSEEDEEPVVEKELQADEDAEHSEPQPKRQKVADNLYLIHNPRIPGEVKIGRAQNVEVRLKNLSSCQNFSLQVIQSWPGLGHLEKDVHFELRARQLQGYPGREWFAITLSEVDLVDKVVQGLKLLHDVRDNFSGL